MNDDKKQGTLSQETIFRALDRLENEKQTPLDQLKPFKPDNPIILKLFPVSKKGQLS